MSAGGPEREGLHERVLRAMVEAVPEAERPAALRRLLDELEEVHRESGVAPPAWIGRLRRELGGSEVDTSD
ncbi:MAG TPA: hypothetical protein VFX98_15065 [Longimicrobiaceae bacterium]|nr:hypothetical protein [Longimicrobiaceae bacterium]